MKGILRTVALTGYSSSSSHGGSSTASLRRGLPYGNSVFAFAVSSAFVCTVALAFTLGWPQQAQLLLSTCLSSYSCCGFSNCFLLAVFSLYFSFGHISIGDRPVLFALSVLVTRLRLSIFLNKRTIRSYRSSKQ